MSSEPLQPTPAPAVTSEVRHIEIAGGVMVVETFSDGRVFVNGDAVEPASVTLDAFHAADGNGTPSKGQA